MNLWKRSVALVLALVMGTTPLQAFSSPHHPIPNDSPPFESIYLESFAARSGWVGTWNWRESLMHMHPVRISRAVVIAMDDVSWVALSVAAIGMALYEYFTPKQPSGDHPGTPRDGQGIHGGPGLTPEQATNFAHHLELFTEKPRIVTRQERAFLADAIKNLVQTHSHSILIQSHIGITAWYAYYDLADLLRAPEPTVQLEGNPYHVVIKAIPGHQPVQFGGVWMWGFAVRTPPTSPDQPGVVTLYVPDPRGFSKADPTKLAGTIRGGVQSLIFAQDAAMPPHRAAFLAMAMEALAGGLPMGTIFVPQRIEVEFDRIPGQREHILNKANIAILDEQRMIAYPSNSRKVEITQHNYLAETFKQVQKLAQSKVPLLDPVARSGIADSSSQLPILQSHQRLGIYRMLELHEKNGVKRMEVYDRQTGKVDYFTLDDTRVRVRDNFISMDDADKSGRLYWRSQDRSYPLGGGNDAVSYPKTRTIKMKSETRVLVSENLEYKVWVARNMHTDEVTLMLQSNLKDSEEEDTPLGKKYIVGRTRGNNPLPFVKDLDGIHFSVELNEPVTDEYLLTIELLGKRPVTVTQRPPTTGQSSTITTRTSFFAMIGTLAGSWPVIAAAVPLFTSELSYFINALWMISLFAASSIYLAWRLMQKLQSRLEPLSETIQELQRVSRRSA